MEMSDISVIYQYIGDIYPILGDFSLKRLSFTKIVSGRPDIRNIDDISTIYRDIFVLACR